MRLKLLVLMVEKLLVARRLKHDTDLVKRLSMPPVPTVLIPRCAEIREGVEWVPDQHTSHKPPVNLLGDGTLRYTRQKAVTHRLLHLSRQKVVRPLPATLTVVSRFNGHPRPDEATLLGPRSEPKS